MIRQQPHRAEAPGAHRGPADVEGALACEIRHGENSGLRFLLFFPLLFFIIEIKIKWDGGTSEPFLDHSMSLQNSDRVLLSSLFQG